MNNIINDHPFKTPRPGTLALFQVGKTLKTRDHEGEDRFVSAVEGTPIAAVAATGTTTMTGANNDWDITAKAKGIAGNSISLAVAIVAETVSPIVTVTGTAITITAASTHTAAECKTALEAHVEAAALISLANKSGNSGAGTVATQAAVTLTGGIDGTKATKGTVMFDGTNVYVATTDTNAANTAGWRKISHSTL